MAILLPDWIFDHNRAKTSLPDYASLPATLTPQEFFREAVSDYRGPESIVENRIETLCREGAMVGATHSSGAWRIPKAELARQLGISV